MKKLNSTGSLWTDGQDYFSYGQQMTASYKGYKLFDRGWWSRTTAKHQSNIRYYLGSSKRIDLKYANLNKGAEYSINQEIEHAEYEIKERETKRKTQKNLKTIDELKHKVAFLTSLLES